MTAPTDVEEARARALQNAEAAGSAPETPAVSISSSPPQAPTADVGTPDPVAGAPVGETSGAPGSPAVGPAAGGDDASDDEDDVDLAAILPSAATLTVGGIPCQVRRIKLRELMLLAQVVSAGFGARIAQMDFTGMDDSKLFALALVALPDAGPEIEQFFRAIVEPRDKTHADTLQEHLSNPPLDDFIAVAGVLLVQEREEFQRLGKQLQGMVKGLQALWRTGKRGT